MWQHYKIPGDDDDDCLWRPCGRFSLYAGGVLLGYSELPQEMIREDGFYRVGEIEPVWKGYLRFQPVFARNSKLKLEQHLRLPAYKNMPELEASEREVQALALRLVAPDGTQVPATRLEITDFARGDGGEVQVFITEEPAYFRYFPPEATNSEGTGSAT